MPWKISYGFGNPCTEATGRGLVDSEATTIVVALRDTIHRKLFHIISSLGSYKF